MESRQCRKLCFQASLDATWLPCSLRYSLIKQQKCLFQTAKKYGFRISILGLWQEGKSFEYAVAQNGFEEKSYIKVMDWIASKAEIQFQETGKLTVVVQDNASIHKSHEVRACWQRWSKQGLLLFFLPPYCSEMNEIETQWRSAFAQSAARRLERFAFALKTHEIAGQMFDNKYDLAMSIIQGMEHFL